MFVSVMFIAVLMMPIGCVQIKVILSRKSMQAVDEKRIGALTKTITEMHFSNA